MSLSLICFVLLPHAKLRFPIGGSTVANCVPDSPQLATVEPPIGKRSFISFRVAFSMVYTNFSYYAVGFSISSL
ncbi:hypothetical protein DW121_08450 [Bacteroides sp. AM10-21B]|nr:hypothetical protein DXC20_06955 [Bacteroides sp. OM08-17BH]RHJ51690.1 hypothetical protein DW121_08450 [Bacteroides sp. AM10-21B]HBO07729.1 hypothetical protein [Bacteroides sp.]